MKDQDTLLSRFVRWLVAFVDSFFDGPESDEDY